MAMPTIEDEVRKVFEAYASREEPPVDRRALVERRVARHRRQRLTISVIALVVVIAGAATAGAVGGRKRAADRPTAPTVVTTPTLTGPVRCDGSTAEPVVRDLLAALDAGRRVNIATYFVTPIAFNIWWDPTLKSGEPITFMPGPGSGTVNLDALQAHLEKLRTSHLQITVSSFKAEGFTDHDYDGGPPGGGFFAFTLRSGAPNGPVGVGEGLVDCTTGKLKAIVIDQW
jgi:hypothetical protein